MATAPQRVNLKPENVDDDLGRDESDIDAGLDDRLSAEEEAQIAAMQRGERDADGAAEPEAGGDDGGSDDGADGADGVDDGGEAAAAGERDADAGDGGGKQADKSQQRPPKTINYGRHQRELAKRDTELTKTKAELEAERAERAKERERLARLDERTKLLMEAINAPKQSKQEEKVDEDPEPNADDDPVAHWEWTRRELGRTQQRLSNIEKGITTDRQQRETETAEQRDFNNYMSEVRSAGESDPTFADAFTHLRESRYTELGYLYAGIDVNNPDECATLSPEAQSQLAAAIQQSFGQEQMLAYREAKRTGRPVSKTILSLARARGFDPAKKAAAAAQEQQEDRGGQQQERRAVVPAKRPPQNGNGGRQPTVGEQVDAVREALASGKSLSDGGGSQGEQLDLTRLADMTDEEFEEVYNKIPNGKFDRMMGKQPN